MYDLIYSTQEHGFYPNMRYENPLYFNGRVTQSEGVLVIGDWPKVVDAYKKAGIPVEVQDTSPKTVNSKPETTVKASDPYAKLNNADLRKAIADMTGQDPPNNTARAKLIEIYEQAKNGQDKQETPAPEEPTPQQAA
ncbi:MAG: hypothetical protein [Bacteriophage sp.]|nr:MAG: hypothetical protein [Bacteriophage sp.]